MLLILRKFIKPKNDHSALFILINPVYNSVYTNASNLLFSLLSQPCPDLYSGFRPCAVGNHGDKDIGTPQLC